MSAATSGSVGEAITAAHAPLRKLVDHHPFGAATGPATVVWNGVYRALAHDAAPHREIVRMGMGMWVRAVRT